MTKEFLKFPINNLKIYKISRYNNIIKTNKIDALIIEIEEIIEIKTTINPPILAVIILLNKIKTKLCNNN